MNCKNCGEPIIWVPDHGGQWAHYRADFTCGNPEAPEATLFTSEEVLLYEREHGNPWERTLSDADGDLG